MKIKLFIVASVLSAASGMSHAANFCGDLDNAFGPFDYRKRAEMPDRLNIVERIHFTKDVEGGIKGARGYLGGDIDYTLRAWPNHPRALATMAAVGLRTKALQVPGANYPVECYFDRAMRFAPDDGAVHGAYANYLFAQGKIEKALAEFKLAVAMEPENATINYNAGLAFFRAKDFEKANFHAQKAYALGFPLPGLKKKLIAIGKWNSKAE